MNNDSGTGRYGHVSSAKAVRRIPILNHKFAVTQLIE
jgi:hypothetical protein